jgi:hypothetical protein
MHILTRRDIVDFREASCIPDPVGRMRRKPQ